MDRAMTLNTFTQACAAFHAHTITPEELWQYLTGVLGLQAAKLRLGLYDQIVLLCGGI